MGSFDFLCALIEIFLCLALVGFLSLGLFSFSYYGGVDMRIKSEYGWAVRSGLSLSAGVFNCFRPFLFFLLSASFVALGMSYLSFTNTPGFLEVLFYGAYDFSPFVGFGKFLVVLTFTGFLILLGVYFEGGALVKRSSFYLNFEACFLLFLALIASFMIVSSSSFMTFYINLEFQTFILYVLASFNRSSPRSAEAGLHYLILGALSTGILLFGISLFYGLTSILDFYDAALFFSLIDVTLDPFRLSLWFGAVLAVLILFFSFFFKLSMAPFHFWTPDVYEGSSTPIMMFISLFGKFSILFVFVKILILFGFQGYSFYPLFSSPYEFELSRFFLLIGLLTVFFGAVGGLYQSRFKRLWGYSAITNFGFVALALSGLSGPSYAAAIFYLTLYILVNFVFFYAYGFVKVRERFTWAEPVYLAQFSYFKLISSFVHTVLCFILISFLSFPPFLNFLAKFYVLYIVFSSSFIFNFGYMTLFLLLNLIASFYYLRLYRFISADVGAEYQYSAVFQRSAHPLAYLPLLVSLVVYFYVLISCGTYFSFLLRIVESVFVL